MYGTDDEADAGRESLEPGPAAASPRPRPWLPRPAPRRGPGSCWAWGRTPCGASWPGCPPGTCCAAARRAARCGPWPPRSGPGPGAGLFSPRAACTDLPELNRGGLRRRRCGHGCASITSTARPPSRPCGECQWRTCCASWGRGGRRWTWSRCTLHASHLIRAALAGLRELLCIRGSSSALPLVSQSLSVAQVFYVLGLWPEGLWLKMGKDTNTPSTRLYQVLLRMVLGKSTTMSCSMLQDRADQAIRIIRCWQVALAVDDERGATLQSSRIYWDPEECVALPICLARS